MQALFYFNAINFFTLKLRDDCPIIEKAPGHPTPAAYCLYEITLREFCCSLHIVSKCGRRFSPKVSLRRSIYESDMCNEQKSQQVISYRQYAAGMECPGAFNNNISLNCRNEKSYYYYPLSNKSVGLQIAYLAVFIYMRLHSIA